MFRIELSEWQTHKRNLALLDESIVKLIITTYTNYMVREATPQKLTKLKKRIAPTD